MTNYNMDRDEILKKGDRYEQAERVEQNNSRLRE